MGNDKGKSPATAESSRLSDAKVGVKVFAQEWDALGEAMRVHELTAAIGTHLYHILVGAGYDPEEIRTLARVLYAHVDFEDAGGAAD